MQKKSHKTGHPSNQPIFWSALAGLEKFHCTLLSIYLFLKYITVAEKLFEQKHITFEVIF
jgi:hypothetical protein